jgi:hypothetical protein
VLVAEQPVAADLDALDDDVVGDRRVEPQLLLVPRDAYVPGVEHEGGDAARAGLLGIGAGEEQEGPRIAGVRDPLLRTGYAPAVARRVRTRTQRPGVRPRLGLGEGEGADQLAARERRHPARALLLGAEGEDRQRGRARVHGDRHPHSGVRPRELLQHEDVGEEVRAGAAELLRHADAHEPQLGQLPVQVAREPVLAVPIGRVRLDLRLRELVRQALDLALLGRQLEVHGRRCYPGPSRGTGPRVRAGASARLHHPVPRS